MMILMMTVCQGALIGSVCAMLLVTWISIGRLALNITYPSLPPTSVERCPAAVANDTAALLWQPHDVTTSSAANHSYYGPQSQVCDKTLYFAKMLIDIL